MGIFIKKIQTFEAVYFNGSNYEEIITTTQKAYYSTRAGIKYLFMPDINGGRKLTDQLPCWIVKGTKHSDSWECMSEDRFKKEFQEILTNQERWQF